MGGHLHGRYAVRGSGFVIAGFCSWGQELGMRALCGVRLLADTLADTLLMSDWQLACD